MDNYFKLLIMRRILIILLIISSIKSFSQHYTPFSMDSVYWIKNVSLAGGPNGAPFCSNGGEYTDLYYAFEATTINDTIYRLVKQSRLKTEIIYSDSWNNVYYDFETVFENGKTSFCFRNDTLNKKVYVRELSREVYFNEGSQDGIKEFLWYDFNLNIGDTLGDKTTFYDNDSEIFTVDSIDSIPFCDGYRKRYLIESSGMNYGNWDTIIEGQGAGLGIFWDNWSYYFEPCQFPYITYHEKGCGDFLAPLKHITFRKRIQKDQLKIFPNPATSILQIKSKETLDINIYDFSGKLVLTQQGVQNYINIESLKTGAYLIYAQKNDGSLAHSKLIVK